MSIRRISKENLKENVREKKVRNAPPDAGRGKFWPLNLMCWVSDTWSSWQTEMDTKKMMMA